MTLANAILKAPSVSFFKGTVVVKANSCLNSYCVKRTNSHSQGVLSLLIGDAGRGHLTVPVSFFSIILALQVAIKACNAQVALCNDGGEQNGRLLLLAVLARARSNSTIISPLS